MKRMLAIDCGPGHVALGLWARAPHGQLRLMHCVREIFPATPGDDAYWCQALQRALVAGLQRGEWRAAACVIGVPGHLAIAKLVKTPSVTQSKRSRVARFEVAQNIPYPLDEVTWAYRELADDGVETELLIGAVKNTVIEPLCATVAAVGLTVTCCEPTSVALWRAVRRRTDGPVLAIEVGARATQLLCTSKRSALLRTLAIGGLGEITTQIGRLQSEIQRSRLIYERQTGAAPLTKFWLGGTCATPELAAHLADALGLANDPLPEDARLLFAPGVSPATAGDESVLLTLTGLAAGGLADEWSTLDLLPATRHAARRRRQSLPWWIASAALLVMLPLPLLWRQQHIRADLGQIAAELQAQIRPLRQLADDNAASGRRLTALNARMAVGEALTARRSGWLALLSDWQARLSDVGGVWLDGLEAGSAEPKAEAEGSPLGVELIVTGRLLDAGNADARMRAVFEALQASPFVAGMSQERFDRGHPGLLGFEITVRIKPEVKL